MIHDRQRLDRITFSIIRNHAMKYYSCYLFIGVYFFCLACSSDDSNQAKEFAIPVKTVSVKTQMVSQPIFTSGLLVSDNEIRLSFKVGGIIERVAVHEGQRVAAGQILAALNLSEIEAQVALTRTAYDKALRDLKRIENLYRDNVATLEQTQNAKTAVDLANANLQIAEFNLQHAVIHAPTKGIILKAYVEPDELVAAGQTVFYFGSMGKHWRVKVGITERDIIRLQLNDSSSVSFDAYPDVQFPASIVELAGSADPFTGTFEAEIQLEPCDYKLISGFVARVTIFSSQKEKYQIIPIDALYEADGSEASVFYIPDKSDMVKKQQVKLGPILGKQITVSSGLEGIGEVIAVGTAYLYDGAPVKILDQTEE
jgi:multidrug efflux system membrane fusion protein